jgi:hypothetical protein
MPGSSLGLANNIYPHAEERSEAARLEAWAASSFETAASRAPQDEAD